MDLLAVQLIQDNHTLPLPLWNIQFIPDPDPGRSAGFSRWDLWIQIHVRIQTLV
jgi:hypothetical protein